ncbi:NADAR family protein [Actinosynnema sp. NPDC020468]|uniref:NADAR family protein n=1 Tax=Actinosynnema sp. NPDC020468 TaxID=3154488 RepID=UPI003403127D
MYSVAELRRAVAAGAKVRYLHFWGHRPERDGAVGRGCLSQWWPSPFTVDGVEFATAEHYMMWRKALLFEDRATADAVLAAPHPHAAKEWGRSVRGFEEPAWVAARFDVVVAGNRAKFAAHPDLREFLLGTGSRVLVEASPLDRVWGIGLAADDPRADDPAQWAGLNLLGFALAAVRDTL